jgi:Protein of unknown function (DUF3551)
MARQSASERLDMRRTLTALALCALGFAAGSEPASAEITYPWCAQYSGGGDGPGGARNCGFWTYQQCMATVSGNGGYCEANAADIVYANFAPLHVNFAPPV